MEEIIVGEQILDRIHVQQTEAGGKKAMLTYRWFQQELTPNRDINRIKKGNGKVAGPDSFKNQ